MKKPWLFFLLTRAVGLGVDTALMGAAYLVAVVLRFDFGEPRWGWRATSLSFIAVWIVQLAGLIVTGCYRLPWRRTSALDLPRYAAAFALSAGVLAVMRRCLPDLMFASIRPPYSITVISTVLAFCATLGVRVLWRYYSQARRDEKRLLRRSERSVGGHEVLEMLRGRTVMVTGAGGTIGSELVRQTARCGAKRVIMVDRGENALYEIDREMRAAGVSAVCVPEMADIADEGRMRRVLAEWKPQLVLHAAAYKHVPMVEANPLDGLRNNALATRDLGEWCAEAGVARFVMISTDKAVNPVSVMGMTKRLAEILLLELQGKGPTLYVCVRFGNVLGSSGSVVPLFREQIARRGPVTVTHPEMKRYFMSVEEAVGLVLEAAAQVASAPEAAAKRIYTLDMGEPVRIVDLAEDMIRQEGYKPYVDVPIVFTGIRPGEKLFEELDVTAESAYYRTGHARIFLCKAAGRGDDVTKEDVEALVARAPSDDEVRAFLTARVGGRPPAT